jgi:hypothetical protein
MATKHIHNPGTNVMFVAGKMIPPGEGRDIDERDLPPELREAAPEAAAPEAPGLDEQLQALRAGAVKEITAALPVLTHEALDRLQELESGAEHPRKTLLTALADERLRRANDALESDNLDGDDTPPGGA